MKTSVKCLVIMMLVFSVAVATVSATETNGSGRPNERELTFIIGEWEDYEGAINFKKKIDSHK
ncbi:hypothetical protein [Alkalihalobacterium sp. APHAB7]|uniref:hypothetical protein n=1 Tax=Alkalihalobacterium sp. APHAB7 TaxID=3402081 RepID=UPI003AB06206